MHLWKEDLMIHPQTKHCFANPLMLVLNQSTFRESLELQLRTVEERLHQEHCFSDFAVEKTDMYEDIRNN